MDMRYHRLDRASMSKVWMITGAGRGLGRSFVAEAVKNGDKVIATDFITTALPSAI